MRHNEIIQRILDNKNMTPYRLSQMMGYKTLSTISMKLKREKINTDNLANILDHLDYELVARPKAGFDGDEFILNYNVSR